MKKNALLLSLLAAGAVVPAVSAEFRASQMAPEHSFTLEEILARSRVSVGISRGSVLNELRAPDLILGPDVWIYTGFRATNVYGSELYDTLVVAFKNDKVEVIRLAKEEQVRMTASRGGAGSAKIAKR